MFGDPDEIQRRLAEFAEQMQGSQRLAWADNAIKLAVDMTVAAVGRVNIQGNAEAQAEQIRTVIARRLPGGRGARARGARGTSVVARPRSRALGDRLVRHGRLLGVQPPAALGLLLGRL